jgi:hypothetical protein
MLSVKDDVADMIRRLDGLQERQIPFAVASGLTLTAKQVQKDEQDEIPNRFRVTKKWWLQQQPTGIKVRPATKQSWIATIYSEAYFAALQEDGGTKAPFKGGKLVIPSMNLKTPRQRKSGGANEFRNKPKVFVGKTHTGKKAIYRRKSKKQVELLYVISPTAHVRKRFGFGDTADRATRENISRIMAQRLELALSTAR